MRTHFNPMAWALALLIGGCGAAPASQASGQSASPMKQALEQTRRQSGEQAEEQVVRRRGLRVEAQTSSVGPAGASLGDSAPSTLTLSTIFLGERKVGNSYEEVVIREGSTLRSGDGLKIVFETNRDAYVYALLLDSGGKGNVIFPSENFAMSNHVRGGQQIEIPSSGLWFFLDNQVGTETIYVLASLEPMPRIGELAARLEAMGARRDHAAADKEVADFVTRGAVKRKKKKRPSKPIVIAGVVRGIGGVKKGGTSRIRLSDGRMVERTREMLSGEGAVVRTVTFKHR